MLAAALLLYPAVASDFFLTQIGGYSLIWGMIALSLMMLAGYGGMVSLAQITVAGLAGYMVAIFGENNSGIHGFGWPWWVVVPFAVFIAGIASALIGAISARTDGIYTIMITLAIATAMYYFTQQNYALFNGFPGLHRHPRAGFLGHLLARPDAVLLSVPRRRRGCLCGSALLARARLSGWRCRRFATTRAACGRSDSTSRSTRSSPISMPALIAGLAGVLLVWFNGRISPGTIGVGAAINVLIIAVIGGMRHPIGPFLGALVVVLMQTFAIDIVGAERFNTLIGLFFLAIVFVSPDGLLGLWGKLKPHLRQESLRSGP